MPKVIDFGVAKATGQQLTEQTLFTGFGAIVGTLEYMSPGAGRDQSAGHRHAQRHLLAGRAALRAADRQPRLSSRNGSGKGRHVGDAADHPRGGAAEAEHAAEHGGQACRPLAANRGTEPAKLTKLVRGELDWIVMKALEKDRNRRYETANGFATDMQRYLADEPVQACPPSATLSAAEVRAAEQEGVLTASVVAVAVAALVAGTLLLQQEQARTAEARARQRRTWRRRKCRPGAGSKPSSTSSALPWRTASGPRTT